MTSPQDAVPQIERVLIAFNSLRDRGTIKDFALIGAYAFMVWAEAVTTEDLDMVVLVDSDEEYFEAIRQLGEAGEGYEGFAVLIDDLPVEMFPTTISDLYREAAIHAESIDVSDNMQLKVVTPEYLIVLALEAWRPKDKERIRALREEGVTDAQEVSRLIDKFDREDTLRGRYESLN